MRRSIGMLMAAVLLCLAGSGWAQPFGPGPGAGHGWGKFKEVRGSLLRKKVGLTDPEVTQVEAILDRYHEERRSLMEAIRTARDTIRELLEQDSDDEAAFRAAVDAALSAERAMAELRFQEAEELGKVLSAKKQARLWRALEKMHRKGMRMMQHQCREHGNCPWGGPGGPDGPDGPLPPPPEGE